METLGQKIKKLRNSVGLTQMELAEELDISHKSLQRYENEQSKPDFYALTRLATFLMYLRIICWEFRAWRMI